MVNILFLEIPLRCLRTLCTKNFKTIFETLWNHALRQQYSECFPIFKQDCFKKNQQQALYSFWQYPFRILGVGKFGILSGKINE